MIQGGCSKLHQIAFIGTLRLRCFPSARGLRWSAQCDEVSRVYRASLAHVNKLTPEANRIMAIRAYINGNPTYAVGDGVKVMSLSDGTEMWHYKLYWVTLAPEHAWSPEHVASVSRL